MKKFLIVGISILSTFALVVFAKQYVQDNQGQALMGDSAARMRQQEIIKKTFTDGVKKGEITSRVTPLTEQEKQALSEKANLEKQEMKRDMAAYQNIVDIVNEKEKSNFSNSLDNYSKVDRLLLASVVKILKEKRYTEMEKQLLLSYLSTKIYSLSETDALKQEIYDVALTDHEKALMKATSERLAPYAVSMDKGTGQIVSGPPASS